MPTYPNQPNWQMEIRSLSPNLAGPSKANGAMFGHLRTQLSVYNLDLKGIRVVVSGVKGLTSTSGLALNPTEKTLIPFKPK